jgi:hypothetical protein
MILRFLPVLGILLGMGTSLAVADPPRGGQDPKEDDLLAHPNDPVLHAEHMDMLRLVARDEATHLAVRDGRWSDKDTWKDGKLPTADADVLVPRGLTVTVDEELAVSLRTVRVDGKLMFAPDRNTCLFVDTLVVPPGGQLVMGTVEAPIAPDHRARILFADRGPIDTAWDANLLSRGLIAHGLTSLVGAEVTPHVALARAPLKGETRLVLARVPVNWKKGDRLILTGTTLASGKGGPTQDEELTILAIAGAEVTVRPLEFDHTVPAAGLSAYVGNLSRNVSLESQNQNPAELDRHGHVMFMHSPRVTLAYAGFYDLGRTDKRTPVNDPRLDDKKRLIAGSGTNPRGRYPVHFHRTGSDARTPAIGVKGCAVVNSPGWGFVNHSSHVDFTDNVAYNVHGAAFVTEAGDEIGSFRRNLAVRSAGSGHDTIARNNIQDFGHEGSGFWLQGGGVAVEDNIAAGHRDAAFFFFTSGLIEEGLGRMGFLAANLPEPLQANNIPSPKEKQPPGRMTLNFLPLLSCKGNIAFASGLGILVRFHSPPATRSLIEDCTIWRTRTGVRILYSDNLHLRNLRLIGDGKDAQVGIAQGSEAIGGAVYENLDVRGWGTGLAVSDIVGKSQVIQGGTYDNRVNIALALAYTREGSGRVDEIKGAIRFGPSSERDIALAVNTEAFYSRDPNILFAPNVVRLDTPKYPQKQLYYPDQGAEQVPLKDVASGKFRPSARGHVPEELIGKTNRELWQQYGLALGGAVAPAEVTTDAKIDGWIGGPATYLPALTLHNVFSPRLEGYRPACTKPGQVGKATLEMDAVDLRPGWNLVSQKVNDQVRSFLVFGGAARPGYEKKKEPGAYPADEKPKTPKEPPNKEPKPMP